MINWNWHANAVLPNGVTLQRYRVELTTAAVKWESMKNESVCNGVRQGSSCYVAVRLRKLTVFLSTVMLFF